MSILKKLRLECSLTTWSGEPGLCQVCSELLPLGGKKKVYCSPKCRRFFERNHVWRIARTSARRRAKYSCCREGCPKTRVDGIEVNHIIPLVGRGYAPSCYHHQENLEVLCHEHHVVETQKQRKERN